MLLPRLPASIGVRLTALYLGLSAVSIVVVAAIVSFLVGKILTDQIQDRLLDASRLLQTEYALRGRPGLEQAIRRQAASVDSLEHRLEDELGRHVVGDIPPVSRDREWVTTKLPQTNRPGGGSDQVELMTYGVALSGGEFLVVGEELGSVSDAKSAVLNAFAIAMTAMVAIGVSGGALLNAAVGRRVGAMAETARAVMAGDLTKRFDGSSARDEFGWLATVFNHMLDRISALVDLNRHIGAALAHDLRSPLSHLLNRLEMARLRANRIEDYEGAIDGAVADVNQILATFGAILRIAQVEAGTRRGSFRRIDVSAVLANVADAYVPVAQDDGQTIVAAITRDAWIEGDAELLTQLFANLIENAIRHAGAHARIDVSCEIQNGTIRIVVADNGPGIPAEHRTRVLDRFVRLDHSRSSGGSGLGLTLCVAITDLHGGTLRLDDNGPGLRNEVDLPPRASTLG